MHRVLYLGLNISKRWQEANQNCEVVHCPVIRIVEASKEEPEIAQAFQKVTGSTHLLFTSQVAVDIFFKFHHGTIKNKIIIAIGEATAGAIQGHGITPDAIAEEECSEGVVGLLEKFPLEHASFFWPHSELSRPVISNFFHGKEIPFCAPIVYTTKTNFCQDQLMKELPFAEELVFTSPSTVDAFLDLAGRLPKGKILTALGPVTRDKLVSQWTKEQTSN